MKKKKYVLFVLLFAFVALSLSIVPAVFAQPEDEEEEPVQARPNPMEKTTKATSFMQRGMKSKASTGKSNVMNKGRTVSSAMHKATKAEKKANKGAITKGAISGINSNGIASNGINSNGINSNGMVADDGQHGDGKVKNVKSQQASYEGVDGESKVKNVGTQKVSSSLNVFKGNKNTSSYGNLPTGTQSTTTQQIGTNPAGWDPTDMPSGSLEQKYGGKNIGY